MHEYTDPAIRITLLPRDTNSRGTIFGGVILSYIDTAGAIEAHRHTHMERFVTVAMKEVIFHKPVYVGDTLTFRTTVADKRPSASRPEWGLVLSHNTGHNQRGELVYEFKGSGFVERRR